MTDAAGKRSKVQGWEEAGSEFYQEGFRSADWETNGYTNKETSAITTLLPSKQNRFGTVKTGRRSQNTATENKSLRFRQTMASTTQRKQTQNDMNFSVLPDLSQVLTDEERIWEEMLLIKLMPVPMHQKKSLKSNLQNTTKLRLQGFNQFKWKHRKAWQKLTLRWTELVSKLELWHSSLKQIEGHFGTGVVAYFLFLRWLFFLNCLTFLIVFIFLVLPNILYQRDASAYGRCKNDVEFCESNNSENEQVQFNILDIIQGSGFLKSSLMFYGAYSSKQMGVEPANDIVTPNATNNVPNENENTPSNFAIPYNLTLAYIFVTVAYFVVVLVAIVRGAAHEFKDRLINGKWQFYQHCNLAFGGWDFCIHNEKSANIKHKAIYNELKSILHSKRMEVERNNRSTNFMLKLILVRIFVNLAVLSILAMSAYFIYFLFNLSLQHHEFELREMHGSSREANDSRAMTLQLGFVDNLDDTEQQVVKFIFDFIPFVAIVGLNIFIPTIFNYLCTFEKYSPLFVVKISLFRTIFLRLASLGVLLSRFYYVVVPQCGSQFANANESSPQRCSRFANESSPVECWETFVGQQFYKLVITDFVSHLLVTLCINFPRALCARSIDHNLVRLIGEQEFELPKHVLDIVYLQTICWLGSFYAPLLPAIVAMITFFMFYVKKFQCLINSKPSKIFYGTSRSNSLFMFILLLSFIVALVPVTYAIAEIRPSVCCGPFQLFSTVWTAPILAFIKLPEIVKNFIFFFGTAGFAIPCFIVLTLLLYYFYAVSDANKNMVDVLRNQLILEGHDKQFLLTRLSVFLKQQQDSQSAQTRTEDPFN